MSAPDGLLPLVHPTMVGIDMDKEGTAPAPNSRGMRNSAAVFIG